MNVTTDYQYYIIKIIKELPDPSFPRVICVPRGWIKVNFPDKVAVALPKEDYSVTATRIKSEEHGDWCLFWAHVQDRTNAFDTAINNARVLNEALLHEAQQKEKTLNNNHHQFEDKQPHGKEDDKTFKEINQNETDYIQSSNGNGEQHKTESVKSQDDKEGNEQKVRAQAEENRSQDEEELSEIEQKNGSKSEDYNESEKIIKENEQEVRADAEKNESQDEEELREIEQDTGSKTEENINRSQSQNQRDSEDNQSYAGTDSVEDEGSEYSDKSWNQSDTDHTDSNTLNTSSSYSYSSSQKNIASESEEDSKSSNENGQQHKTKSVKSQYDKVTENESQDEEELREIEKDTGSKTEENINRSQSQNQRDSEDNQSYAGTDSVEDEGSEYSDKSWNQSDTDHTDSNTLNTSSSYSYSSSQKNIASESEEDSKSSNENRQQHKTESVKSQYDKVTENEQEVRAKAEENQLQNEEELREIEQDNGSKTEVNVNKSQSENQRDSEDNQSNTGTNSVEDISSEYFEEFWNPSDTDETESSETEDDSKGIPQKNDNNLNERKRKLNIVDFSVNNKKSRLTNESQIDNVATPSTSGEFIRNHKLLSRNELKDTRRKFMKSLVSKSNELEKHFIQLDDVLEIIGTILNKITGSFVEAIHNVKLMINDENLNCNGSIKHNSGQNTVDQIPKNQRNNFVDENEESVENSDDNDREYTPPNCDAGHSSNSRCSIQTLRDSIDEGSKWTLRHKEFKPQPGLVELLPGGGIYVSSKGLQKCRTFPDNTPNSMARHLLSEIFSDKALRRCTLIGGNSSKPRLDGYARRQLMMYVGQYFSKKGFTVDEEFEKSISKDLGRQLYLYSQNKPARRQFYI